MADRETLLNETFVALADTLVGDFDVVEFLSMLSSRCVDLFDADDAGLLLADEHGHMQLAASSSHRMQVLEVLEVQHNEGPSPDAYRTGVAVQCPELREATERWPVFAAEAMAAGFRSAHALPMRLRADVIGALVLLCPAPGPLPERDIRAAQALADVATIGILHHRAAQESRLLAEQLEYALTSRIIIEQAKGIVAERLGLDVEQSYETLRRYSRQHNRRLVDLSRSVVEHDFDTGVLAEH